MRAYNRPSAVSGAGQDGARAAASNRTYNDKEIADACRHAVPFHCLVAARVRAVVAASIGNALEWFDLVVYGFFAVTISKLFFPAGNDTVSLLLTLGTFGVSFFMRPLGAIVLGAYADRAGRKAALTLSILLMMGGTLIIAVLPTYETIGVAAPVILVAARLMQGFSAGGEFGSATAFLAEHVPGRRGFRELAGREPGSRRCSPPASAPC